MLENVSSELQERLGADGTLGLLALLEATKNECAAEMNEHASLRFERRLSEETAHLRVEFRQGLSDFRLESKQDMNDLRLELKQDMNDLRVGLGREMQELRVEFKQEMNELRFEMKGDMAGLETRVQRALLHQTRWIVGMWVGQFAATAAMMGAMFQIFRQ